MVDYPHVPAAFINAIAEEGTKEEAVKYLQKQWNETCYLTGEVKRLKLLVCACPSDDPVTCHCDKGD